MFKSTVLALGTAAALFAGQAAAWTTCTPGVVYCGYHLRNGNNTHPQTPADRAIWTTRIDAALPPLPITPDTENQSLFRCGANGMSITHSRYCLATPGVTCQTPDNNGCRVNGQVTENFCCA